MNEKNPLEILNDFFDKIPEGSLTADHEKLLFVTALMDLQVRIDKLEKRSVRVTQIIGE